MEKIVTEDCKCTINYKLPIPATWQEMEDVVLPIDTVGGAGVTIGRTFSLEFNLTI